MIARSLARSLRPIARSNARSLDRSIARSIARSLARSLDRSLAQIISGVRISNYEYCGKSFVGSNFRVLVCIIFISPVSEFRITFQKNYERTFLLFQGVRWQAQLQDWQSAERYSHRFSNGELTVLVAVPVSYHQFSSAMFNHTWFVVRHVEGAVLNNLVSTHTATQAKRPGYRHGHVTMKVWKRQNGTRAALK